jgi:MFS family permease
VAGNPDLAVPLLMMALAGTMTYEFQVSLPVMARTTLAAGAAGFGFMTAAMGVGAALGGLVVAARGHIGLRSLVLAASAFGVAVGLAAVAPNLTVELFALAFVGWASVWFMSTGNSTLQLSADPSMRGRVMALWFVAFQGSTAIGGPLIGWVMSRAGARAGLGVGAVTCLLVAAIGALVMQRRSLGRGEAVQPA